MKTFESRTHRSQLSGCFIEEITLCQRETKPDSRGTMNIGESSAVASSRAPLVTAIHARRTSREEKMASAVERSALDPPNRRESAQDDDSGPLFAMQDELPVRPSRPRSSSNDLGSLTDLIKPSQSFEADGSSKSYFSTKFLPKNPRDTQHSPMRRSGSRSSAALYAASLDDFNPSANVSVASRETGMSGQSTTPVIPPVSLQWQWTERTDPEAQEQALFEQRLCEDAYGVAVRKINQNGKSTLRYVKCVPISDAYSVDGDDHTSAARSVSSIVRSLSRRKRASTSARFEMDNNSRISLIDAPHQNPSKMALTWGRKKAAKLALDRFLCVRKGKTTDRTRRNPQPAYRLLSLITDDVDNPSLDIEAPTRLDRDKFARAFAKFLKVPLQEEDLLGGATVNVFVNNTASGGVNEQRSVISAPSVEAAAKEESPEMLESKVGPTTRVVMSAASQDVAEHLEIKFEELPPEADVTPVNYSDVEKSESPVTPQKGDTPLLQVTSQSAENGAETDEPSPQVLLSFPASAKAQNTIDLTAVKEGEEAKKHQAEEGTIVSSLTGAGFDQEIVEELHNALTELRAELEASRAEAARAVKVAEQAIQSAESSSSKDWSSTVTHKAAEAAALAQKRSADAMAKMRQAEERLTMEKKNAAFWRKQAEAAEEDAGLLQTRVAAAEVQRAAMKEELENEHRKQMALIASMKGKFASSESHNRNVLEETVTRNRSLEMELERAQNDLQARGHEMSSDASVTVGFEANGDGSTGPPSTKQLRRIEAEAGALREQFQLLRKCATDEIERLPSLAQAWATETSQALVASRYEIGQLRSRLAMENATRRKLLHEAQDLRGVVRVYCRLRPSTVERSENQGDLLTYPSQETLLLHRSRLDACEDRSPMSFEFDRIFHSHVQQPEIYAELEELVLGVLDGYNICVMAYGPSGCGKTHCLLGDVQVTFDDETAEVPVRIENHGLQLLSMKQLFAVSQHRNDRYHDVFSLSIVEVREERLCDLVAGTIIGEARGQIDGDETASRRSRDRRRANSDDESSFSKPTSASSKGKQTKLEIRTNHDGDTVVQGLVSVSVSNFGEVMRLWEEGLAQRAIRMAEQGVDSTSYDSSSSVIATLKVISTNVATGIASVGKIQFVDLAGADLESSQVGVGSKSSRTADTLLSGVGNDKEWKFVNKSLSTLSEVASARSQFMRSVPYRNSTLTHLLRDSLEHDTKVLLLLCVSSDVEDVQETACALRMASRMRRINIGKATKHTLASG